LYTGTSHAFFVQLTNLTYLTFWWESLKWRVHSINFSFSITPSGDYKCAPISPYRQTANRAGIPSGRMPVKKPVSLSSRRKRLERKSCTRFWADDKSKCSVLRITGTKVDFYFDIIFHSSRIDITNKNLPKFID